MSSSGSMLDVSFVESTSTLIRTVSCSTGKPVFYLISPHKAKSPFTIRFPAQSSGFGPALLVRCIEHLSRPCWVMLDMQVTTSREVQRNADRKNFAMRSAMHPDAFTLIQHHRQARAGILKSLSWRCQHATSTMNHSKKETASHVDASMSDST